MNILFTCKNVFVDKNLRVYGNTPDENGILRQPKYKPENNFDFIFGVANNSKLFWISNSDGKFISIDGDISDKSQIYSLYLSDENRVLFEVDDQLIKADIMSIPYVLRISQTLQLVKVGSSDFLGEIILVDKDEAMILDISDDHVINTNYVGIIDSLPYVTPVENLQSIIDSDFLYSNIDRINLGIMPVSGFGDANESKYLLCDARIDVEADKKIRKRCADGIGITMGVLAFGETEVGRFKPRNSGQPTEGDPFNESCCLYFSPDLLTTRYYHVNTNDNLGFYFYNDGTNIHKLSFNDSQISNFTPEIYHETKEGMEILVAKSIPLEYLLKIVFARREDYLNFKPQLDEMNIASDYYHFEIQEEQNQSIYSDDSD